MNFPGSIADYTTASNGGEALFRRWKDRIKAGTTWFRLYWFGFLTTVLMAVFALRVCWLFYTDSFISSVGETMYWTFSLVAISVGARIQLLSLPTFIALNDFQQQKWETLRSTPIKTSQVFFSVLKTALLFGVIPSTVVLFATVLAVGPPTNTGFDFAYDLEIETVDFILMLIGIVLYCLNISALALIFGTIIKRPYGAVIGAMLPIVIVILLVVPLALFSIDYFQNFGKVSEFLVLLTVPEGYFGQVWTNNVITGPAVGEYSLRDLVIILAVGAVILWGFAYFRLARFREAYR